jgi:hypothetical protein
MYGIAAGIGVACALLLGIAGARSLAGIVPEWVGQLGWLACTTVGAAVCGFVRPDRTWRWGVVIIAEQPVCVFLLLAAVGVLQRPSRSTGGLAVLCICAFVAAMFSPLPILASYAAVGRSTDRTASGVPGRPGVQDAGFQVVRATSARTWMAQNR